MVYEGVDAFGGRPQLFRGETGAQSGVVPALDAALGVPHAADPLRTYLMEMRDYYQFMAEGLEELTRQWKERGGD